MNRVVEIRSYTLKPGVRDDFHRRVVEDVMPLLGRAGMDVVAFGPSPHDENSYFLIRAFDSLAHRESSEDAFYGGASWREGPREAILARIEAYTQFVLELDEAVIDSLRSRPAAARS